MIRLCLALLLCPFAAFADPVDVQLLPGWRDGDRHVAGIAIDLAPGWKTYWRSPGEAGLPPVITWQGADGAQVSWPVPEVLDTAGARVLGYHGSVVLPVELDVAPGPQSVTADIMMGICQDICVPVAVRISADLPATGQRDSRIVAALASEPQQGGPMACAFDPTPHGLRVTAKVPSLPHRAETVVELADPNAWVDEPTIQSGAVVAEVYGEGLVIDRSGVRLTVISGDSAVEYMGCD